MKIVSRDGRDKYLVEMTVDEWIRCGWPGYGDWRDLFLPSLIQIKYDHRSKQTTRAVNRVARILKQHEERYFPIFRANEKWLLWKEWKDMVIRGDKDIALLALPGFSLKSLGTLKDLLAQD